MGFLIFFVACAIMLAAAVGFIWFFVALSRRSREREAEESAAKEPIQPLETTRGK